MRLLLDSHTLVWSLAQSGRLSRGAVAAIEDEDNELVVSVASIWELAIKRARGRQVGPPDVLVHAERLTRVLPIEARHAEAAADLPRFHGDPFDRMLVAQAQVEDLVLLTADRQLRRYDVATMPAA